MLLLTTQSLANYVIDWELLQAVICATWNSFALCFGSSYMTEYNIVKLFQRGYN